jgi:hypothetical protein
VAGTVLQQDKLYDTMIEILELKTKTVLADVRIPGFPLNFLDDHYVATYVVNENHIPQILIWQIDYAAR